MQAARSGELRNRDTRAYVAPNSGRSHDAAPEPRYACRRDHRLARPRPDDGQSRRLLPPARPDAESAPLGDPAVDRLPARVQGPAPATHAAQPLYRAVL